MNAAINKKLSKRLRELRKKKGLTQEDAARLADIEYKHYQNLESKSPDDVKLSTLEKLADAFQISVSKLLNF